MGQGALLVLNLVAAKFIFARLGQDALGLIYFVLALNGFLIAFLEMGISATTTREISRSLPQDPAYVKKLIQTTSFLYWGAYTVSAVGLYFVAPFLAERWISLETMNSSTATLAIRILGVAALFTLPQILYASIFRGIQRMEFNNAIDVIASIIQQAGVIVLVLRGGDILQVSYFIAVSFALGICIYLAALSRFFYWDTLIPRFIPVVFRRIIAYASSMMSISVLGMVYRQVDKVILSRLLPIGVFGYYSTAYAGLTRGGIFADSISQAAFPSFSVLFQEQRDGELKSQYARLQNLTCFVAAVVFAGIVYAAFPVFSFVFNQEIARLLFFPVMLLALGFFMHETVKVPYFFSLAVGRPDITLKANLLALATVLPVSIALIYRFGLLGAGLAWIAYHAFIYGYGILRICKECLSCAPREWYTHVLKIGMLTFLSYGTMGFLVWRFTDASLAALGGSYLAASAVFLLLVFFYVDHELIENMRGFIAKSMQKFIR